MEEDLEMNEAEERKWRWKERDSWLVKMEINFTNFFGSIISKGKKNCDEEMLFFYYNW